jgi:hypothetical protein
MTVKKFLSAPIDVRLWNGNFNKAVVKVKNNKIEYVLELSDTHLSLREFSIIKSERVEFVVWRSAHTGTHEALPTELEPVVQKMREKVKMTDEYAMRIYGENLAAVREFHAQFLL